MLLRNLSFLKTVFVFSLTSFGGPQAHFSLMLKYFVHKVPYVTENELMEYNAFCNLLPGASSTQMITLVGYKRGGVKLAVLTLLIWITPACLIMGAFSFLLGYTDRKNLSTDVFQFIPPMAAGFLLYALVYTFPLSIKNTITSFLFVISALIAISFFGLPWIIPSLILAGGIATNFSRKRIPQSEIKPRKTKWWNLWLFAIIFILAGILSGAAKKENWHNRKPVHLFENTYRLGSLVFGGGQVLMPMMYEQWSVRPEKIHLKDSNVVQINADDLYTGMGIVRGLPGPVFSIASFTGGMALKDMGFKWQVLGCIIGSIAIFLPSALLVLFFFPVWEKLKKYAVVYRSIEGINAVVLGILLAATYFYYQ